MKKLFLLTITLISLFNIQEPVFSQNTTIQTLSDFEEYIPKNHLLSLEEAEKILGQKTILKEKNLKIENDVLIYNINYIATTKDSKTEKTGSIYFMYEKYDTIETAKKSYLEIKKANQTHERLKILENTGDEAYFHSDKENFYFVLVRKDEKMFRIKVNKITSKTSLDEFNLIVFEKKF